MLAPGSMTREQVLGIYEAEYARLVSASEPNTALQAYRGTRTRLHEALQAAAPPPAGFSDEDPDDHHQRQKTHGKALWKLTDKLVAEAGITEAGLQS